MADEKKNDMAFTQVSGTIGCASHLVGLITDRNDARQVYDATPKNSG
jgi:hypothetical protein